MRPAKAGAVMRVLAVILALVLAFITAVAIIAALNIGELTPCEDVTNASQLNSDGECFDGSSTTKLIALIFGWPGAILAGVATMMALAYTVRGRGGRQLITVIVVAAVLMGLSLVIG